MDAITRYRTTDLDLFTADDLSALAAGLEARGLALSQHVARFDGEGYFGSLSPVSGMGTGRLYKFNLRSDAEYDEPEPEIAGMLAAIEALDPLLRAAWAGCPLRVFDIAYDCGLEPFAFRQELSAELLARLAAVGATLRVTLYSDPETGPGPTCAAPVPAAP